MMSWLHSSLDPKHGYHRSQTTTLALTRKELRSDCSLHLLHNLPPDIFVDPYELAHYEKAYTFEYWGTTNLELPVAAVSPHGTAVLLNITIPKTVQYDSLSLAVQVPMHLRYGRLLSQSPPAYHQKEIPWPVGFLACPISSTGRTDRLPKMPIEFSSLFDSLSITSIPPRDGKPLVEVAQLPTGDYGDLEWVEIGTVVIILVAFAIVSYTAYNTAYRITSHSKVE